MVGKISTISAKATIIFLGNGPLVDGGGWVIINGKLVHIPPRGPRMAELIGLANALRASASISDAKLRTQVQEHVAEKISKKLTQMKLLK
jgi:hypothetical protein